MTKKCRFTSLPGTQYDNGFAFIQPAFNDTLEGTVYHIFRNIFTEYTIF
jgi:hypothetical protein